MPHHVITICSTEDAGFQEELDRALAATKKAGLAVVRDAADFADEAALAAAIEDADAVLVLLTPALINSPLWNGVAMQAVLATCERRPMPVVPVLVQRCDWRDSWLSQFSGLPRDGRALSERGEGMAAAWADVGAELHSVFKARAPRSRAAAPER